MSKRKTFEKADDNRQEARQGFEILSLNEDVIWSCGVKDRKARKMYLIFQKATGKRISWNMKEKPMKERLVVYGKKKHYKEVTGKL